MAVLLIAAGGVLGVLLRHAISEVAVAHPLWATAAINVTGSFVLGVLLAGQWFDKDVRDGLTTGFLGGFTTFSTFSVQAVMEVHEGRPWRAAAYLAASIAGGMLAAAIGYSVGRR